jgi:DNA processing protein
MIIEASGERGSLITAQYALERGRKLFAVPGNIGSPVSRGAHSLIRLGATLVEGIEDILTGVGVKGRHKLRETTARPLPQLSPDESAVLQRLSGDPKHIDALMHDSRITAGALSGALITLESERACKTASREVFCKD